MSHQNASRRDSGRRRPLALLLAAPILALGAWLLGPELLDSDSDSGAGVGSEPTVQNEPSAAAGTSGRDTNETAQVDGIPACPNELPAEATDVVEDIEAGGPYDYPRNDGQTFQNREGLLPEEHHGYYREFTVETPGSPDRGARRIVTGGTEETNPEWWFYTEDHYESFCTFAP